MLWLAAALALHGDLARDAFRRAIEAHRAEVVRCYQAELERRPQAQGKLVVVIDIAPGGAVDGASVQRDEVGGELASCVLASIQAWKFPPPGELGISVSYPFLFRTDAK